ncbi:MAG: beta galactosidase jelly roll domain-containing protein [Verrucomicrobia bacterium]|nr:beta galactosidase jelly roll domain-containing protein [Verrucomicrobiota bacterium]
MNRKSPCTSLTLVSVLTILSMFLATAAEKWQPAKGPLMTRWAKDVSPKNAHPEYPRPQMVRKDWQNLNGLWNYAVTAKDASQPTGWDGQILVPFPIESALSGVMKRVYETNQLWYQRTFTIPRGWRGKSVLLNFGAVDWETTVWVNGQKVGTHRGGYDAFSFDVTSALKPEGEQEIVVSVWDPADAGPQPRGKQVRNPHGIWYTPTSGIWQTVWLEPVAKAHISTLKIIPDIDNNAVTIGGDVIGADANHRFEVTIRDGRKHVYTAWVTAGGRLTLPVKDAKLWSPDSPHLYSLEITLNQGRKVIDRVESYFGMRKISLGKDEHGNLRLHLNNEPLFHFGPLDQGFWPDGLYTAPTDEALRYDIEMTKKLGFNMARKHVKIEPARWYYWADKLGLLVWQDMPSGDRSAKWRGPSGYDGVEMQRTPESAEIYERELRAMIAGFHNHPSIVVWVPFNEGWGQFDTVRILNLTKQLDPTRLVNGASGGNHFPAGDMLDHHQYPGPGMPARVTDRAMVLGEYGGLGLPVKGHTWQDEKNWGYRSFTNAQDLTDAYIGLIKKLHPLTGQDGLAAAIYTQTTDVEVEINGLMTYDRAVVKMDEAAITAANKSVYGPPPRVSVVVPTADQQPATWRYTTTKPDEAWAKPGFDDSSWKQGQSGFGTAGTPGAIIGTTWNTPDIWMRREVELPADQLGNLELRLHHDEDAEVYINGVLAARAQGFVGEYFNLPLSQAARAALKPGKNLIAVHCRQTGGGQYIDLGFVEVVPATQ